MPNYFVTGELGGGKTLVCVGKVRDYILAGKPVATNIDLNLEYLLPHEIAKCNVIRLPDHPTIQDLEMIGHASNSKQEKDNGLLLLDELGTWFNSRNYRDTGRQALIDWLIHSRKKQWDLALIVQDVSMIDKQAREALKPLHAFCRRTDRMPLPLIGLIYKILTGYKLSMPRVHVAIVTYGEGVNAMKVDTWAYRGVNLFKAYNTNQIFDSEYEKGPFSYLPPALLNLKRFSKRNWSFFMRLTKIYWRKYERTTIFFGSVLFNLIMLFSLLSFFSSDGVSSVSIDDELKSSSILNEENLGAVVAGSGNDEPKRVLTRVPFIEEINRGKSELKLYVDGVEFSTSSFPYDIQWINKKPYYMAESKEAAPSLN